MTSKEASMIIEFAKLYVAGRKYASIEDGFHAVLTVSEMEHAQKISMNGTLTSGVYLISKSKRFK